MIEFFEETESSMQSFDEELKTYAAKVLRAACRKVAAAPILHSCCPSLNYSTKTDDTSATPGSDPTLRVVQNLEYVCYSGQC